MAPRMRVSLFVSCLVDTIWPDVGVSTVQVLRRAGCDVSFEPRQTCCGQPAFNTGYQDEARRVAGAMVDVFADDGADAIVIPSGSCAAMVKHAPELFDASDPRRAKAEDVAARTHELSAFLVDVLGVTDVGARFDGRLVWHDGCHGLRDLGIAKQPRVLLENVAGVELLEAEGEPTCCGFGGTFSVKQPEVSIAMLDTRLETLNATKPDVIVSGDVSCLMQIDGRIRRQQPDGPRVLHLAQVLASR